MMQADIIKIGNSKGVRLPAALLKQCGIDKKIEIEVKQNHIILKPLRTPRQGWAAAFKKMHKQGDDQLMISDELDAELLEDWDD